MLEEHRHWCPWITKSSSPSTSPITDGSPILPVKIPSKTLASSSTAASAVQVDNVTSTATNVSVTEQKDFTSSKTRALLTTKQQMPGWKVVLMTVFPALGRSVTSSTVSVKCFCKMFFNDV